MPAMVLRKLPRIAQIALLANAGAAIVATALAPRYWVPIPLWQVVAAIVICCALDLVTFRVGVENAFATLGSVGTMAVFVLMGPAWALVVCMAQGLTILFIQDFYIRLLRRPRRPVRPIAVIHGVTNAMTAGFCASWLYLRVAGHLGFEVSGRCVMGALIALVASFVINTSSVVAITHRQGGPAPWTTWRENFRDTFPHELFCGASSLLFVSAEQQKTGFWLAAMVLVPTILLQRSYSYFHNRMRIDLEQTNALLEMNDSLISSIATAIEAKDHCSWKHVFGVRIYAEAMAQRLHLSQNDREAVRCAAMVHDIGKIGVPEHLLRKSGPLTPSEFEEVKKHVEVGASILRPVPFPWPVVELVYSHHERWDGKGYPKGLAGSTIPIGARILAVADAMDSLMGERPYRPALTETSARDVVRGGAGTQFDPVVVAALMDVIEECRPQRAALDEDAGGSGLKPDRIDNETMTQISRANTDFATLTDRLQRTEELAYLDPLTSLLNARAMYAILEDRALRAALSHEAFTIILMDLDNFKMVNDSMGHLEGDCVLQRVAQTMQACLRPDDVLCRYAGDEFVLVIEQVSSEILGALRNRLVASVEVVGNELGLPLGASVGCATLPEDGLNARDLLDMADRRMYRDKAARKATG
ncbi:MAG TPA: HD domain-containing phosphohydrolase [Armatimonadota bacterium]|jgi:diguanylate cyclase (GGDEF)-like protein/putative nucleotidyltransferase with HDIG domain